MLCTAAVSLALVGYGLFLLGSQPGWGVATLLFVVLGVSNYRGARPQGWISAPAAAWPVAMAPSTVAVAR